jgi:hypothetical protein
MTLAGAILGKWRAEPVPIPPNLAPAVDRACRANLGPDLPDGAVISVIDARGQGVVLAYYASDNGGWGSCAPMFVDPAGRVSAERGHVVSAHQVDALGPRELEFTDFNWCCDAPITASYLVGRAGGGITRVEIRSPGRASIVTSSANGWWAAWTPGPVPAPWRIVALDALGREVDVIEGVSQDSAG